MLTVTQLANRYQLSRTTILYYEREGLLLPRNRSENGYRWYGDDEIKRLESIIAYRSYGVPIKDIASLLNRNEGIEHERILRGPVCFSRARDSNITSAAKSNRDVIRNPYITGAADG